jgi:hypothetical protein
VPFLFGIFVAVRSGASSALPLKCLVRSVVDGRSDVLSACAETVRDPEGLRMLSDSFVDACGMF